MVHGVRKGQVKAKVRQARVSLNFCGLAPPRLASKASYRNKEYFLISASTLIGTKKGRIDIKGTTFHGAKQKLRGPGAKT